MIKNHEATYSSMLLKVTGKYTKTPELHEKGELREAGGKAAVHGGARAPHD